MNVDSAAAALRLGTQLRNLRKQEEEAPPPHGLTEEERQATFGAVYERYFGAYFKAGDEGAEARARLAAIHRLGMSRERSGRRVELMGIGRGLQPCQGPGGCHPPVAGVAERGPPTTQTRPDR